MKRRQAAKQFLSQVAESAGKTRVARGVSNENGGMEGVLQDFDSQLPAAEAEL